MMSRTHGEFCMRMKMDEDGDLGNQQSSVYMNVDENEYLQKLPETSAGESFQTVLLSESPHKGRKSGVYLPSMVQMKTL